MPSPSGGSAGRRGDERLPVDRHLLDALAALPTAPRGPDPPGPRRQPAHRRRRHGAVRGPGHQPPPRPRRPLAARRGPRLLHDRLVRPRGQRRRRRGAPPDRPGPPPLPLRRLLRAPGHAGPGTRRPARRAARARGGHRRAHGRRAPQGLRPPRPGRSSRRPRPSRPTCRGRSASPSASAGPTGSACRSAWPADASPSAASATRRPTTRRRPAPSTPPPASPTSTCRCRCCSSARTTASASACAPRRAGSRPPTAHGPTCAGSRPTAPIPRPRTTPRGRRATGSAPSGRRRSCTCAPSGSWPTPAPTWRPRTGRPAEIRDDYARDPLLGTARLLAEAGVATPTRWSTTTSASAPRCGSWPRSAPRTPS